MTPFMDLDMIGILARLAKKEEIKRSFTKQQAQIKEKLEEMKKAFKSGERRLSEMKDVTLVLMHKNAALNSEISQYKHKIDTFECKLKSVETEISALRHQIRRAQMIQEKEERTLGLYLEEKNECQAKLDQFWLTESGGKDLKEKRLQKKGLDQEHQEREKTYDAIRKQVEENLEKLKKENMLTRKRNLAVYRRASRRLAQLEDRLAEREKYLKKLNLQKEKKSLNTESNGGLS